MNDSLGMNFTRITESGLLKVGSGFIAGVTVASHSSGTMKILDGLDDSGDAVKATATLTIAGGNINYAKFPSSIVTVSSVQDGDTVTIGSRTYTAKTTLSTGPTVADEVLIGGSDAVFLDNLLLAVNNGAGEGTNYSTGTAVHADVIATTNTDSTQTFVSRVIGTANNDLETSSTGGTLTWEDTTLGGGTGSSVTGVDTSSSTFVIDGETYYFTNVLHETLLGSSSAVANEILWVTNDATALDKMKSAINATGAEGTDYGTGTNAHPRVRATTNANDSQTVESIYWGTVGNNQAVSETGDNMSWGAGITTLSGGLDGSRVMVNTYTFPTGSSVITFPKPINFTQGLHITIGNTADITVSYA